QRRHSPRAGPPAMRREAFDTPGEVTLDLRVAQGRVELEAVPDGTTTEVELDARGNDEEVSALLEEARLEARERQGGYEVDVQVDDAGAGVKIRTASGDQRIGGVTAGSVELQSMSGDISIGIRQGSNVWVDARAMSGDLSSELELGDEQPADDAPLVELRAASMSGDVNVVRAPALTR